MVVVVVQFVIEQRVVVHSLAVYLPLAAVVVGLEVLAGIGWRDVGRGAIGTRVVDRWALYGKKSVGE